MNIRSRTLYSVTATWNFRTNISDVPIIYLKIPVINCGPGSPVSIAKDYGLDGPGSNPCGDEIFRPSRLALGPT